jgi:hypothetical protein
MAFFSCLFFRRLWVGVFICVCGAAHAARADRFEYPIGSTDEEVVEVKVSSFTEAVPAYGVVTLKVEVRTLIAGIRTQRSWRFLQDCT